MGDHYRRKQEGLMCILERNRKGFTMDERGLLFCLILTTVSCVSFVLGRHSGYKMASQMKIDRLYEQFCTMTDTYKGLWHKYNEVYQEEVYHPTKNNPPDNKNTK